VATSTARTAAASILALVGVLAQRKLLLELAAELAVHGDQLLADRHDGLARRDGAVGLDAQEDFGHVGVTDWMGLLAVRVMGKWKGENMLL
jgi:hypothetical protein